MAEVHRYLQRILCCETLMFRTSPRLCNVCSHQLLALFKNGFTSTQLAKYGGKSPLRNKPRPVPLSLSRSFALRGPQKASVEHDELQDAGPFKDPAQMEAIVRQARQTFGETLPENFLSNEEYQLYERLYGPPSATTRPEDIDLLQDLHGEQDEVDETLDTGKPNVLMRENEDGDLEEIVFDKDAEGEIEEAEHEVEFTDEDILRELEKVGSQAGTLEEDAVPSTDPESEQLFQARMQSLRDNLAAHRSASEVPEVSKVDDEPVLEEPIVQEPRKGRIEEQEDVDEEIGDEVNEYERSDTARAHPLTSAGEFGTSPSTIHLPKDTLVDPVTALLADASNKHLADVAQKTFGGPRLPHSTATMRRPNLVQQTIALEASQGRMGEMESNAYLAAIYPGAYASIISTLIEVRKRLGSDWLRDLMSQPSGPRILDAGSGGAAVLAWREVIRAEYEAMNPSTSPEDKRLPFGKSTVVTGSSGLRQRASALLDNTTFIPRLPDYDPTRDHPSLDASNLQPRKQYDIIIAPYTLWSLKEDYMRKSQIQNFWSLLEPHGGVLILIEKGVPRGFELIAAARDTLLKHHISSPGSEQVVESPVGTANPNRFTFKEEGMIIAPCTNHGNCPMYITAGKSQGRKDFCHFNQRFLRPAYLQRILGERDRNHEDISFSYVALRRGRDLRKSESFTQGQPAADAAFEGYENHENSDSNNRSAPNSLSMPRAILPPIKRRGHVILDLCTPAGKIERWTVPKSFSKQAYHDARKSKWGDLWALGAKTRVQRNVRVGMRKAEAKGEKAKRMREALDEGEVENEVDRLGNEAAMGEAGVKEKNAARGRKGRSGREKYPKKAPLRMVDEDVL